MKRTTVKCNVSSCHYWGEGEVCEAPAILVANRMQGSPYSDASGALGRHQQAHTSEETVCETFRPRD
ncbi:MAG: DUF1540 domain-containing protein [Bacillota bacterium]